MLQKNKRGAVGDTIIGIAALFVIVLVTAVVSLILFEFNEGIQESEVVTQDAKEASAYAEGKFGTLISYGFLFGFIGFFMYTIITSVMISRIHPIFWVIGFVLSLVGTIFFTVIKQMYGTLRTVEILGPYVQQIPFSMEFFNNIELIGVVWIFAQFTLMYKFREEA